MVGQRWAAWKFTLEATEHVQLLAAFPAHGFPIYFIRERRAVRPGPAPIDSSHA
jgi:hypothetical protein